MLTNKRVLLHIGLPKTGSTALQTNFFIRCPGLHYLGKPRTNTWRLAHHFIRSIVELDTVQWNRGFDELRLGAESLFPADADRVVISEEEFSMGAARGGADRGTIANRLKQLFPQARVLAVIRNQLTALPSLYCHAMTLANMPFMPFDDWLTKLRTSLPYGHGLQLFRYADLVDHYATLFAADDISVLTYEDFRDRPDVFMDDLARILSVDASTVASLSNREHNTRPSRRMVWALRLRERHPDFVRAVQLLPRPLIRQLTRSLARGKPLDTSYTPESEEFVRNYYAADNRRLGETRRIDLKGLGYPT
jgi:hypothetical protein